MALFALTVRTFTWFESKSENTKIGNSFRTFMRMKNVNMVLTWVQSFFFNSCEINFLYAKEKYMLSHLYAKQLWALPNPEWDAWYVLLMLDQFCTAKKCNTVIYVEMCYQNHFWIEVIHIGKIVLYEICLLDYSRNQAIKEPVRILRKHFEIFDKFKISRSYVQRYFNV